MARQALKARKKNSVLAHLHLLVESSLLRQVSNSVYILLCDWFALKEYTTLIGHSDAIDYSDKGGLTCTIWTQQAIDRTGRNSHRHVIQGRMLCETLSDVLRNDNVAHNTNIVNCIEVEIYFIITKVLIFFVYLYRTT